MTVGKWPPLPPKQTERGEERLFLAVAAAERVFLFFFSANLFRSAFVYAVIRIIYYAICYLILIHFLLPFPSFLFLMMMAGTDCDLTTGISLSLGQRGRKVGRNEEEEE